MKKLIIIILLTVPYIKSVFAQDISDPEKYGRTLNLGAGIGYTLIKHTTLGRSG